MYAWTITADWIADPDAKRATNANAVGVIGPRGTELTAAEIEGAEDAIGFRMFDDDGELYYQGFLVGADATGFEPLDDFGRPNAGCTQIDHYDDAKRAWVRL